MSPESKSNPADSGLLASSADIPREEMTVERARVIAVGSDPAQPDSVWVETLQSSTCGSCAARSGCGQGVMRRWLSRDSLCLELHRADGDDTPYAVGQWVEIAIPQGVVVKAALLAYLLPIFMLMLGAAAGSSVFTGELGTLVAALLAFAGGIVLARRLESRYLGQSDCQPRLLGLSH